MMMMMMNRNEIRLAPFSKNILNFSSTQTDSYSWVLRKDLQIGYRKLEINFLISCIYILKIY